jgi:hypothetical protein
MVYETGGYCKCMSGYAFDTDYLGNKTCKSLSSICSDKLGFGARYNSLYDTCECGYGDVIDGGRCTSGDLVCHREHGFHSDYNSSSESCECDSGYTFDDDGECVEKQNNVYFTLLDVDTENNLAIIKSDYDGSQYLVEYGYGCYSFSIERYMGYQLVVNLGTDFYVDMFDKIVLQDDDEVCDITDVERTYEDSFPEPEEKKYYYQYYPTIPAYTAPTQVYSEPEEAIEEPEIEAAVEKEVVTEEEILSEADGSLEDTEKQDFWKGWWVGLFNWVFP